MIGNAGLLIKLAGNSAKQIKNWCPRGNTNYNIYFSPLYSPFISSV